MTSKFPLQTVLFLVLLLCMLCSHGSNTSSSEAQGPKISCVEAERRALLNIKHDLEFENDTVDPLSSWGTGEENRDCCKWLGVRCAKESGHVVRLDLSQISTLGVNDDILSWTVAGNISPSLFELRDLTYLDFSFVWLWGNHIPSPIGNLSRLRYLNLSYTFLGGEIPPQLSNLSSLQVLDLGYNHALRMKSLNWVSHLSSLRNLRLSGIDLSRAYDWFNIVNQLPSLTNLQLAYCYFRDIINPSSLPFVNLSTSLAILDLSNNNFSASIYPWLFNLSNSLFHLDLSVNQLEGSIPESFGKMTSLAYLDLSHNYNLNGSIPEAFGNMTALAYLALNNNNLKGSVPDIFSQMSALAYLDLGHNMFDGEIPKSVMTRNRLRTLKMSSNNFTGHLPETAFQQLRKLETLDISRNSLGGVIFEAGFENLSELVYLDLSFNSLTLKINSDWIPPFRLRYLYLGSCNLGPQFPKWLQSQQNCSFLDISYSGISDSIPNWFWELSIGSRSMNLSNNRIVGEIGNISLDLKDNYLDIDLSSNHLEGPIPSFLYQVEALDLSRNKFSELNFPCNVGGDMALMLLDISYNELIGELPDCWSHFKQLIILILTKNKLSGKLPLSIGSLEEIETLQLSENNFVGELPSSLKNCTRLSVFDLGENELSGPIPTWIGENLQNLIILSLRSNNFNGSIPSYFCHLKDLQILDLSLNDITGNIPKCISSFIAMKNNWTRLAISHIYSYYKSASEGIIVSKEYEDRVQVVWKGKVMEFKSILRLVKSIDLSSNKLTGEIPRDIGKLDGLVSLNLSRNKLTGQIPQEIGHLEYLDVLDLSRNFLAGQIPSSLTQIYRLNALDLSYNNLSGKIPTSTQLQSFLTAYMGNPKLCGPPLPKKCPEEGQTISEATDQEVDELVTQGFYISMAVGFVVAFWGVCGLLIFKKSFRYAYFKLLNDVGDFVWVTTAVHKEKLLQMIKI